MKSHYLIAFILIITTFIVFLPVSNHDFVGWDDPKNVYENPLLNPATPGNTMQFWKEPKRLYIPLTYTFWSMIAGFTQQLSTKDPLDKLNPHYFHTVNIIIHILSVLVVFAVLRILIRKGFKGYNRDLTIFSLPGADCAAGLGALLFAIHPIQVEPVAWVTGLKDLLCGLLSLIAVWQYLLYAIITSTPSASIGQSRFKPNLHYIIASLAFVLALLSKPTAIFVPIVAWMLDYLVLKRPMKDSAMALSWWIILTVPLVILTKMLQSDKSMDFITPLWARPLVALDAVAFYLYKLIAPFQLGPDYSRSPEFLFQQGLIYFTWLIPCGLMALIFFLKVRTPLFLASGIFIAGILPVSGLVPFGFQDLSTVADRYLYFSMLGPSVLLAWLVLYHKGKWIPAVCLVILSLLGIRSMFQTQYWKNSNMFFQHALKVNPNSYIAHNNLALVLAGQGKLENAIDHYHRSIRIKPNNWRAYNNLGVALATQGKHDEAISIFNKGLDIYPVDAQTHNNLGSVYNKIGKHEMAINHFSEAIRLKPDYAKAYYNKGVVFSEQGKIDKAIVHFFKALKINPAMEEVHYNLGTVYYEQGENENAIKHFSAALSIKPNYIKAHNNLGITLASLGKFDEAIKHFSVAIKIKPNDDFARYNLNLTLKKAGRLQKNNFK